MTTPIKIIYNKCAPFSGNAKFSVSKYEPDNSFEAVTVEGTCTEDGWVFCGTCRDPDYPSFPLLHGPKLQVYGGTFEIIVDGDGFPPKDDQDSCIKFKLSHDGSSPEILVIYGTKQRGHS